MRMQLLISRKIGKFEEKNRLMMKMYFKRYCSVSGGEAEEVFKMAV